jgi:hypothetical protein
LILGTNLKRFAENATAKYKRSGVSERFTVRLPKSLFGAK